MSDRGATRPQAEPARGGPGDGPLLLVFAHPDDETIGSSTGTSGDELAR
jgi:hypothetical protein